MYNVLLVGSGASTISRLVSKICSLGHQCQYFDARMRITSIFADFMPSIVMVEVDPASDDSFEVISTISKINSSVPIIAFSDQNEVSLVVTSIKRGAAEFFQYPSSDDELVDLVKRIIQETSVPAAAIPGSRNNTFLPNFVGNSDASKNIACRVMKVAPLDVNVMISGETGTGKELIAKSIHKMSNRSDKPFIPIDCVSLPPNLIESEIFGHEQGAFTGATKTKKGLLELANGGTVFLDEISELDIYLQGKLLRVLQERKFRRVGGNSLIDVDIRIVSATNRDPEEAVLQNKLRQDLYYRLNVVPLKLSPLRERKGDIAFLIDHFIEIVNRSNSIKVKGVTRRAMSTLLKYDWPGNVRELQNAILQAVYLSESEMIDVDDLPENIRPRDEAASATQEKTAAIDSSLTQQISRMETMAFKDARDKYLKKFCQSYFEGILKKYDGNISEAAKEAQISRGTIYKIFKDFDIKNPYVN